MNDLAVDVANALLMFRGKILLGQLIVFAVFHEDEVDIVADSVVRQRFRRRCLELLECASLVVRRSIGLLQLNTDGAIRKSIREYELVRNYKATDKIANRDYNEPKECQKTITVE